MLSVGNAADRVRRAIELSARRRRARPCTRTTPRCSSRRRRPSSRWSREPTRRASIAGQRRDDVVVVDRVEAARAVGVHRNRHARRASTRGGTRASRRRRRTGTLRRAIVVGTSKIRHVVRTTASAAIFEMLYVGIITRWLSPSGSVSRCGDPSAASYTPVDEQCRNACALAAVRHEQTGRLRVAGEVDLPLVALDDREVAHVVDVVGHVVERAAREVDRDALARRPPRAGRATAASLNRATAIDRRSRRRGRARRAARPVRSRRSRGSRCAARASRRRRQRGRGLVVDARSPPGSRAATAWTNCSSGSSTSTPSPFTCVRPPSPSIVRSGFSSLIAKRPKRACHSSRAAASPARDGHADVVGVGRELEREMERLPARRIRADAAVDVAAVARPEGRHGSARCASARSRGSASGVRSSNSRMPISLADARSTAPLAPDVGEELLHGAVETRLVVVLARREVREQVAHAPALAPGRLLPVGRRRAREEPIEPGGLGSPSARRDRVPPDPDRRSSSSPSDPRRTVTRTPTPDHYR